MTEEETQGWVPGLMKILDRKTADVEDELTISEAAGIDPRTLRKMARQLIRGLADPETKEEIVVGR